MDSKLDEILTMIRIIGSEQHLLAKTLTKKLADIEERLERIEERLQEFEVQSTSQEIPIISLNDSDLDIAK